MSSKTLDDFADVHGQKKMKSLERKLAAEKAKVEALAGVQNKLVVKVQKDCVIRFAVVGDTHIGSLYHHEDALNAFYEHAVNECGVETILHAGDVIDGHKIYKGQEFELRDVGLEAQVSRLGASVPRIGKTVFITGNHDQSFKHLAGVHVGKQIEAATGWQFVGEEQARITYKTPNGDYTVMMIHPGGGTAYALSYKPQKIVESLEGGNKPNMILIGHYHKAEMMPSYRNITAIQAGTFQKQTPFMARQGLAAHVGGWIVEVAVGESWNAVTARFFAFYK
jgi:DNA polymerase II small subunit/DNA polymerase delta subunit B